MITSARLLLSLVFLTASLAGASFSRPDWLSAFGKPEPRSRLEKERRRQAPIKRQGEIVRRRLEAKRKVARQLIEGHLTLFQAAALFDYLNNTPEDQPNPRAPEPYGHSPGEKLCREVIGWAKSAAGACGSAEACSRITHWEDDLQAHLAANGGVVVLPEE